MRQIGLELTELQRFGWMYTGAEVFTDRVFLYSLTNASIAYTGGWAARNKFNHTHAVSWEGFGTDYGALVLQARPDILNHNTETVPRLYRIARSGARYARTLSLLERSKELAPDIPTKSGIMVGLGETLLHPQVVEFVGLASSQGRRTALVTNGMLLDRALSQELLNAGLDSITFSIDGADWNMIGLDKWVEARKVAQVIVDTKAPDGSNGAPRWIDVNLAEQTLAVYDQDRLVFATMIASGVEPFWTRPGVFQIQQKKESETMRNNDPSDFYYLEDVPWTMYFDGPRALHGAYWRTRFGYPQSHGCVNLSVGDAHWLFDWAQVGDWVYVHDPTGQTPTDPALYKGGAY